MCVALSITEEDWDLSLDNYSGEHSSELSRYSLILLGGTCAVCASFSVVSDSLWFHGLQPTRVFCPWDFLARILECIAISFSRRSSQLMNQTQVSCIGKWIVCHQATWLPLGYHIKDFFLQIPMLKIMISPWTLGRAAKVNFDRLKDSRLDYYKKGTMNPQGLSSSSRPSFVRKTLKDKENMKKKLFKVALCVWLLMTRACFNGCWILCQKWYTSQAL